MDRGAALLGVACAVQIATYACFFNLQPLLPLVGADLNLDAGALGALVGVGGIVGLLVQLPAGSGGDTVGRRPFFALGMLLLLSASLLRWQAYSALALLAAQVLAGAALGIVSTNAFALMAEARRTGVAFGIVNASVNVGQVVGYLVAGTAGAWLGWHDMSLAMAALPLVVLALVLSSKSLKKVHETSTTRAGPLEIAAALSHPRRLTLAALAALTLAAGVGACYLVPFAVHGSELGPLAAAIVLVPYVLGSVATAPFSGAMAERFGPGRVIAMALLLGIVACVLALAFSGSLLALAVCNVLIGASVNTTLPIASVLAVTLKVGPPVGAGTAIAGLRVGQSLGPFVGPTVVGAMLARSGEEAGWVAIAACLLLGLLLHLTSSAFRP
jgi:MFS family permease